MVEGGLFEFEEALRLGIINYLWPAEENGQKWWDRVMAYAQSFCPPNKASRAVGRIKRSVQSGGNSVRVGTGHRARLQQQLFRARTRRKG